MNLSETRAWALAYFKTLKRPCAVLLDGDLGVGKTQITKWFLEAAGNPDASSPTFAVHQEYPVADGKTIDHVDLYRLKDDSDLESSGFWDLLKNDDAMVFVEWADRLPHDIWPDSWLKVFIKIKVVGEGRELEIAVEPGSQSSSR